MVGCADFETTTLEEDCRVWAYSISEIGNPDNFLYGNTIEGFFKICSNPKINHTFYFHNLKFDGEFIFYYLFREGFKIVKNRKELVDKSFCTLITDKGVFYSIEICFNKKGHKTNKVVIMDSMKILNFSVSVIAKCFNLPIQKLEIDYKAERKEGYILTQLEIDYIRNDVEIVARALKVLFDMGMDKMTIGADALAEYKESIEDKNFSKLFPIPDKLQDSDVRESYKGGFTYLNPKYKNKIVTSGIVLDVNSLYPSVMYDCLLPFGEPIFFVGKYEEDKLYNLYTQKIICQFELKPDHIPTIQIKRNLSFMPTEYLTSSGSEEVVMTLTSVDLELFFEHYNVYNIEYIRGYKYKSSNTLFRKYIDKWIDHKKQAKKDNNAAMYTLSKLMLNSLYGKFAVNPKIRGKYPYYTQDDKVKYEYGEYEDRKPIYIGVGTFITSWARSITIRAAQTCYDRFIYADTDSLHLEGYELPEGLRINDYELGQWKHEFTFSKGKYIRQKSYMEYGREPGKDEEEYLKVTCAGMPTSCYKNVTFENFKLGTSYEGKLQQKRVKGGIILKDVDFTLKE